MRLRPKLPAILLACLPGGLAQAQTPVSVSVDPSADRRPVSPLIYGVNFGDAAQAAALRWPVRRWGGNAVTRYSWQHDISNRASDWFFYNIENANPNPAQLPSGSASDHFIDETRAAGSEVLLTVPLIGWTPTDRTRRWGFSVAKYGAQQQTECTLTGFPSWCNPDAGNGVRTNGSNVTGNDPNDTSRPIGPSFVTDWMTHIASRVGSAAQGGVRLFALDNEPSLWNSTHRDVHPAPLDFDEIWQRTRDYAAAIKARDPAAQVLGPAEWGWCAYFTQAADVTPANCLNGPDRQAHGGLPFLQWYLKQVREHELLNGVRLVDYLDIHYYPQASGVALSDDESAATSARRLRSLRSLYDPGYVDESWIGEPVRLIPRMKEWIAAEAPGTKLAITEYSFGNDDGASSALAQAEALAIFGREGVDLATRWVAPEPGTRVEDAFKLFLDFDGSGGRVLGDSVRAVSSAADTVGAYALQGGATSLRILLFNRDTVARQASVSLASLGFTRNVQLYGFDAANRLRAIGGLLPVAGNLNLTLPARSATLAAVPLDFVDVAPDYWAYPFVDSILRAGITAGCNIWLPRYCPADVVNRDQMAVFMLRGQRGAGWTPPAPSGLFADLPLSHWGTPFAEEAYRSGFMTACASGPLRFCPGSPVPRDEMAMFLLRARHGASYQPPAASGTLFADVPASHPYAAWIEQLYAEGVTAGCSITPRLYCPTATVNRDQIATFLTRAFNLP